MTSFHVGNLIKKLEQVTTTQESIQTLSLWVLHHKSHCKQIVEQWLACYQRSKSSHQLALFYLANDIVQHSRKKSPTFLEEFKPALRQASKLSHDPKTVAAIKRVLNIWAERAIYSKEFIDELRALYERDESRKLALISKIVSDYSLKNLQTQVEGLSKVEKGTQACVENARNHPTVLSLLKDGGGLSSGELGQFKEKLKDKSNGDQYSQEYEEAAKRCRLAIEAFDKELLARRELLSVLEKTKIYHDVQFKEAKTVAATFRNCELGLGQVKAKLDATFPHLSSSKKSAAASSSASTSSSAIADSIPTSTLRSVMNSIQQAQSASSSRNPSSSTTTTSSLDQRLSLLSNSGTFGGMSLGSSTAADDENTHHKTSFHAVYDPKFQPYYNPSMDFSNLYKAVPLGIDESRKNNSNNNNSSTENTEPADMDLVNSDEEGNDSKQQQQQQPNNSNNNKISHSSIETGPMAGAADGGYSSLMGLLPYHNLPPPPPPPQLPPSLKDFIFPNGAPPPFAGGPIPQLQTSHIPLPPMPALMIDQMMAAGVQQQLAGGGGGPIRPPRSQHTPGGGGAPYSIHPPPPQHNNSASDAGIDGWRNNPSNNNSNSNNNRNHQHHHHHHPQSNNSNNQGPNNHRGWNKSGGNSNNSNSNRGSWKQRSSYGNHH